jgi:hypothetical protein
MENRLKKLCFILSEKSGKTIEFEQTEPPRGEFRNGDNFRLYSNGSPTRIFINEEIVLTMGDIENINDLVDLFLDFL